MGFHVLNYIKGINEMKIFIYCIIIVSASAFFITGCVGIRRAATTIEVKEEQDLKTLQEDAEQERPGFKRIRYDGSPSFSLEVPAHFEEEELMIPEWVIHMLGNPIGNVVRLVAAVFGLDDDAILEEAPDRYMDHMKTLYPSTTNYHVEGKKVITLNDGTKALRYNVYYIWTDGYTAIRTAIMTAFKNGKGIQVTAACHLSPIEDLEMLVNSFQFE